MEKNSERLTFYRAPTFGALALLLLTLLIYIPSYKASFIWDDDTIAGHPLMREGWHGLKDIWFSIRFGDFCPMTATSFWVESQIYGGLKEIQHATNIVLQALNVVLLWRILLQLRIPAAWIIAAVFAVHPVCVASVTWLAERKNTLSMFFYFLSLLFYLRSETTVPPSSAIRFHKKRFWLSFTFFICGLLSKTSVVVLPVILLLCDWWRCGKIERRNISRVLPFFIFAFAAGVTTLVAHFYFGPKLGVLPTGDNSLTRILTASRAFWFYLWKDFLPVGLTMHYPRWKIDPASFAAYLPSFALITVLTFFWKFRGTWGKACLFGLGYFLLAAGPTIGVVNMAFLMMAPVADHLQYLALPGIIALVVGGAAYILSRRLRPQTIALIFFTVLVCPLAVLSWQHQRVVSNPEKLWRDNLGKNPVSWISHNNLGGIYFERGQFEEALHFYEAALQERDNLSMLHVNVGRALFALNRTAEAVPQYAEAIRLDKTDFKAHNNLGVALITLGKTNEAISSFAKAVELAPGDTTFFVNLARVLIESGRTQQAVRLFQERLQRVPNDGTAHYHFAGLLFSMGKIDDALPHYEKAVQLLPQFVEARFGLAEIMARKNKKAEAVFQWRQILKMKPDAVQVLANLAWALATDPNDHLRNGTEAVKFAEQACAMTGRNNPAYLDLLAAAYAEAGNFNLANKTEEEAIALADATGQKALAEKYESRLNLYRTGKPLRVQ